jgi:hypothetical protein
MAMIEMGYQIVLMLYSRTAIDLESLDTKTTLPPE